MRTVISCRLHSARVATWVAQHPSRLVSRLHTSSRSLSTTITPQQPSLAQLRIVALRASIPMVGFGFIDNMVMLTAGEAIDMSLGVTLGLSTMAAAGLGQCVSDVAGLTFGGMVDATVAHLRLPQHGLSPAQLSTRAARLWSIAGGCFGVVTGCLLGMSCLFFMDTDRAAREKRNKELNSIFATVMEEGHTLVDAERATLWMVQGDELWSRVATGESNEIHVQKAVGVVGACVETGTIVNVPNAYDDPRFNPAVDKSTGYHTRSLLVCPVMDEKGKVVGAIQMINKKDTNGDDTVFGTSDEKLVRMLALHVAGFLRIVHSD